MSESYGIVKVIKVCRGLVRQSGSLLKEGGHVAGLLDKINLQTLFCRKNRKCVREAEGKGSECSVEIWLGEMIGRFHK